MDGWKNRIIGHEVRPAKDFLANPMNFRIHPKIQQDAMSGSLDELGWIDDVLVNVRTGHVINGHLRITLALRQGDETPVPTKLVDLSPDEELTALATFDPITALATHDRDKLDELLRDTKPQDEALQQFLCDLAAKEALYQGNGILVDDPSTEWQGMPEFVNNDHTSAYKAIVHFATEADLRDFEVLIGQTIPTNTKAIWFPKAERDVVRGERYSSDQS